MRLHHFIILAVFFIGALGWGLNIVALAGTDFSPLTGMAVLRCIGIFVAPLGAILGFI